MPFTAPSVAASSAATNEPTENAPSASSLPGQAEPDMAAVIDKLEQVRAIDPAAEQLLLEELRRTPAKSWPLVAEQFRASLAYREQLSTRKPSLPPGASTQDAVAEHAAAPADARPSVPINTLADPRRAKRDAVTEATERAPYTMGVELPEVPGHFTTDGPVYRIATDAGPAEVVQTSLEAPGRSSESEPTPNVEPGWQELVKTAAADLAGRVPASPATTAEVHQHVSLRLLRLLAGNTEEALEPIPHISPTEQDYWSRQLFALATFLDHHTQPDDKRRAAASAVHLDESVAHLRELGSLALRNLSFCNTVHGYGAFDPCGRERFAAGERVTLYVEVENYHSRSTEKGFQTLLGSSYEIVNDAGERVGGGEFPDVDDYCRSRRRDFHIQYGVVLPESLAGGRYRLRVIVKDRQSEKIAQSEVAFEVGGVRREEH